MRQTASSTSSCSAPPASPAGSPRSTSPTTHPTGLRWGLAGRNPAKLEGVRDQLGDGRRRPGRPPAPQRRRHRRGVPQGRRQPCPGGDHHRRPLPALRRAAGGGLRRGRHGLRRPHRRVRVRRPVYVAHHATAQQTGARIVHACGFDSVPHDLGAYFTVQRLADDVPITLRGVGPGRRDGVGRDLPHGDERVLAGPAEPSGVRRPSPGRASARGAQLACRRREAAPRPRARPLAASRCRPSTR